MKKILLLGKEGQIGWELQRTLATLGEVMAFGRKDLDLSNMDPMRKLIRSCQPQIIVNAAAYTAVDMAEKNEKQAFKVNTQAVELLAEEAKKQDSLLVHYSTDFVFNGLDDKPYAEKDKTQPLNVYGASKLAGEKAIVDMGGKYLIFRTAWVYGNRRKNFLNTVLELAKQDKPLSFVGDQIGSPTWCRHVAEATAQILACSHENPWGIYHMTCGGEASRFEFAEEILKRSSKLPFTALNKIQSEEYITPAKRPKYSVLDNQKLYDVFGLRLPDWKVSLDLCLAERVSS